VLKSEQFPNIKAYWQRLQQRESYKAGILDFEEEEWAECKAALYGDEENPDIDYFWSEVERLTQL
jgi:hypothetical protein